MINRKTGESAKVARLHAEYGGDATTFFCLLIAWLDVNGNVRADDWWLKGNVCPEVAGLLPGNCRATARALAAVGLAVPYEVAGKAYLHFPGFREEQPGLRPDRERAEVPQIPKDVLAEWMRATAGQLPGNLPATAGQLPARAAAEVEVEVEVEGRSSLRSEPATDPHPAHANGAGVENSGNGSPSTSGDPLTAWLGPHAPPVDACPMFSTRTLRESLFQLFGPPEMRTNAWRRDDGSSVPPNQRPRLFATAAIGYGGEPGKRYMAREFALVLHGVIGDEQTMPRGPDAPLTPAQYARYREIRGELEDGGMDAEEAAAEADQRARRE